MPAIIIGFAGMSLILLAFLMNQTGKWKADFLIYDLSNFAGAMLLVIYSILIKGYPFLILNSIWALVSLRDVFLGLNKKNKAHLGHKKK